MAVNNRGVDITVRRIQQVLDQNGLEWRDVARHLKYPEGMVDPKAQPLTVTRDLRLAKADVANLDTLLQYGDCFPELADGRLDRTKIARLALRLGIEQMFHEIEFMRRGGD